MKYKTIFFDLDGTITDSAPGIMNSIKYALEKNHLPMLSEEQLRSFIGPPLRGQFCKVCGLADEESARMVEDYREYYRDKGIFENNVYVGKTEKKRISFSDCNIKTGDVCKADCGLFWVFQIF